jgi:uncharacterized protein (TIGR02246 family)
MKASSLKPSIQAFAGMNVFDVADKSKIESFSSRKFSSIASDHQLKPSDMMVRSDIRTFFSSASSDKTKAPDITDNEVRALFSLWNDALATLDADKVAKRYSKNGVLLPTVSDLPRTNYDLIKSYFVDFLQKKPQGVILESYVTRGEGWAQDVGIYEFTLGSTGDKVKARYTYVYVYEDGEWKISHHHSSILPEGLLAASSSSGKKSVPDISVEEVQGLFTLWNDALATLNPDAVTARYAKNGILLPTVSNIPRTSHETIRDYFVNFLQKKPQGIILESNVLKGDDWALDAGIYEFTFGATGDVARARYSYMYTYEDGEWKISHHHSSVMPEK